MSSSLDDLFPKHILSYYLQCNGKSDSSPWSCIMSADLRVLSVNPDVETLSRKIQHRFHAQENYCCFSNYLNWDGIENGYIKQTDHDTITFGVQVSAESCEREITAERNYVVHEAQLKLGRLSFLFRISVFLK